MKKLERFLNVVLWIIWAALTAYLIFLLIKHKAPKYEYYKDISIEYVHTSENGNKENSNYYLAWHHPQATLLFVDIYPKKSVMCFYDPKYNNAVSIKDEYISEYKEIIPKSNIERWKHWITSISLVGIILFSFAVYLIGRAIRDFILFCKAKADNKFQAYAYFRFKKRMCCAKSAKKGLLSTINPYIKEVERNDKRYSPLFITLLIRMLNVIKQNESTEIPFYYYFTNDAIQQKEFLKDLSKRYRENINSYETRLNINPDDTKTSNFLSQARERLKYIDSIRNKEYVTIRVNDVDSSAWAASDVLDKLFIESYGDKIIRFKPYGQNFYSSHFKKEGTIIVNSRIHNTESTFTFSGRSEIIPGLRITITISCYQDGKEHVLWQHNLPPKCTYTYVTTDGVGAPNYNELYANMIQETIKSFPDEIKKL